MNANPLLYLYCAGLLFYKRVIPLMICFFLLFCSGMAHGQTDNLKGDLAMVLKLVKAGISRPAYMEEKLLSTTDKLPGWEGTAVSLYQYHMYDAKTRTTKSAKVYLANAADELMARWIISACRSVEKEVRKEDVLKLIRQINGQSGGQFPVLGIVYEDMNGTGINTPYVFKDGVTVLPASVHIKNNTATTKQIDSCLALKDADLKTNSGVYGRICSTTREQYYGAGGKNDVGSSKVGQRKLSWLATVRTLYRQALKQDHNELITAWAKTNL